MKEGPTEIQYIETRCHGCKHHKMALVRSGRQPLHRHQCHHPGVVEHLKGLFGEIEAGREIGESDETPRWCPYLGG